MESLTSTQLGADIAEILKGSDVTTVTSKKIRKQLEEKYGCDLMSRKTEIDKISLDQIVELTTAKAEKTTSKAKAATNGRAAVNPEQGSSAASDSEPEEEEPPAKRAKPSKAVKRESQDSDDDDKIDDADLARKLQEEEEDAARRTRHGNKPSKTKTKTKRKKAKNSDNSDDEDTSTKKKKAKTPRITKYNEPCHLSPQLAAIMGETMMKRSDVVKKIWAIVKERNLYDPRNKQFMICDQQMQTVFLTKRVRTFGMMSSLKNHIFSPDVWREMQH